MAFPARESEANSHSSQFLYCGSSRHGPGVRTVTNQPLLPPFRKNTSQGFTPPRCIASPRGTRRRGRGAAETSADALGLRFQPPRPRQLPPRAEPPPARGYDFPPHSPPNARSAHSPGQGTQHRHEVPAEAAPRPREWRERHQALPRKQSG